MTTIADRLVRLFDDPSSIWRVAFNAELDDLSRRAFLTLATLPTPTDLMDLAEAVRIQRGVTLGVDGLTPSLRSLDDTFVSIDGAAVGSTWVSFLNPSLLDFAQSQLDGNPETIDALQPFQFLEQVVAVVRMAFEIRSDAGGFQFPGVRREVLRQEERLLTTAADRFDRPAVRGLIGQDRLIATLDIVAKLDASRRPAVRAALKGPVIPSWKEYLKSGPSPQLVQAVRPDRVREFLREVLDEEPIAALREAALAAGQNARQMEAIEALRRLQEFTPASEDQVREEFGAWLEGRLDELAEVDSEGELIAELQQLEGLSYWMSDDLYARVQNAYQLRIDEFDEAFDYDEYRDRTMGGSTSDPTDAVIEGIFRSLQDHIV